jgi:hypothetical protein
LRLKNEITGRFIISLIYVLLGNELKAQSAGNHSFYFIDVSPSPRITGLGGVNVTLSDGNMFLENPALLDGDMSGQASFNHYFYYAGIQYNTFNYVQQFDKTGTWGIGFQQAGYGPIESYDASGNSMGEFKAGEYSVTIGNSHKAGNFTVGGDLKIAFSNIGSYRASALMTDIGIVFRHPTEDLSAGLTIRNLGFVMNDYSESSGSTLPFDIRTGISYKPAHMPFRFSCTLQKLTETNIIYYNDQLPANQDKPGNFDKVFSHVVLGTELVINKNLSFFGGYNHLIRKELSLQEVSGGAGFSYGLLISIKAFSLSYAGAHYHVAGGTNHLGLSVNVSSLYKRKKLN